MLLCVTDEISANIQCLAEEVTKEQPLSPPITPTEIEEADGGKENCAEEVAEMETSEVDDKYPETEDTVGDVPSEEAKQGEAAAAEPVDDRDVEQNSSQDSSRGPSEQEVKNVQSRLREMARKTKKSKTRRGGRRVGKKLKRKSKTSAEKPKAESATPAEIPKKVLPAVKAKPKAKGRAQQQQADDVEIKWAEVDDEQLKKKVHSVVWLHHTIEVKPYFKENWNVLV